MSSVKETKAAAAPAPTPSEKKSQAVVGIPTATLFWLGSKKDIFDAAIQIDKNCGLPQNGTLQWAVPQLFEKEKEKELWILQQPSPKGWLPSWSTSTDKKGFTFEMMIKSIDVSKFQIVQNVKASSQATTIATDKLGSSLEKETVEYLIGPYDQLYLLRSQIWATISKYERQLVRDILVHDASKHLYKMRCWHIQGSKTLFGRPNLPCPLPPL